MIDRRHKLGLVGSARAVDDFAVEPSGNAGDGDSTEEPVESVESTTPSTDIDLGVDAPTRSKRFGKYQLLTELGRGDVTTAYLAVAHSGIQDVRKPIVIKVLDEKLRTDAALAETFAREARIAAELSHPNIVLTHAVGQEEGRSYVAMEYLEGVTLREIMMHCGEWPLQDRLPLFGAICLGLTGLGYVHEFRDHRGEHLGLIHRNIKPENIFITATGQVKLLDFGGADTSSSGAEDTAVRSVRGAVQYLPPEAAQPEGEIDLRWDLFSCGVVLAELATGRRFWNGLSRAEILTRLAADDLPSPILAGDEAMPPPLTRLLERALLPDAIERFQSALELRKAIQAFLTKQGYRVSSADLARIVGHLFEPIRQQRDDVIRAALGEMDRSRPSSASWGASASSADLPIPTPPAPVRLEETAPAVQLTDNASSTASTRTKLWYPAAALLLLVLAVSTWMFLRTERNDGEPTRAPLVAAESAPSTAARAEPTRPSPASVAPTPAPGPTIEPIEAAPPEPAGDGIDPATPPALGLDDEAASAGVPAPTPSRSSSRSSSSRTDRARKGKDRPAAPAAPRPSKGDDAARDDPPKPQPSKKVEIEPSPYTR